MNFEDRKFQTAVSIDLFTESILLRVGKGNRSKGVRLLARRWAEDNKLVEKTTLGSAPAGRILPVPGLEDDIDPI